MRDDRFVDAVKLASQYKLVQASVDLIGRTASVELHKALYRLHKLAQRRPVGVNPILDGQSLP